MKLLWVFFRQWLAQLRLAALNLPIKHPQKLHAQTLLIYPIIVSAQYVHPQAPHPLPKNRPSRLVT
jgi:hypothetical protein